MSLISADLILSELKRLRKELEQIEKEQEDETLKHDEQAYLDEEWTRIDTMIYHYESLYKLLTRRHTYNETEGYTGGDSNFNDGDY